MGGEDKGTDKGAVNRFNKCGYWNGYETFKVAGVGTQGPRPSRWARDGEWKGNAGILSECRNSGLTPRPFLPQGQGRDAQLDTRLQGGAGECWGYPSSWQGFYSLFLVSGTCVHEAKDLPDLQTSCSAASWTLILSLTLRELADNLAIKIIRKLTQAWRKHLFWKIKEAGQHLLSELENKNIKRSACTFAL